MGNVAVYKKGTTNFFSQGLGLLSDVVSSNLKQTVSSTGNVGQKLEVEYPIDGYLVSELVEGAILRVSVSTNKSDYGVFEIVDTLKDDSGTITVYGDPYYNRILRMSFDNGGVFTKFPSVQSALDAAKQNITGFPADFNLISNLNTSVDLSENTYDTFGKFLEALNSAVHGNIKYSLNSIQIYSALGKDITDITLRDDMNTSSVKITTDFSGIINKVIPVLPVHDKQGNATDQTKVGTIVTSKYSNQFLDYWAGKVIHFDTQDIANTYFDRTKADRPVQTVDVDPIGLDDDFSTINIFDTIKLYSTRLDYTDKLRVSERVLDTLSENVISFKLGGSSVNIFNQINEQNNEIFNNVVKLTNAAISANGKGIDYFGQAKPSSPKEGNTWFWDDGTDFGIKQYTNGEWVDLVGSNTAEKISAGVTEAVSKAKSHIDEVKQGLSSDIATAKSQAASLANAAEANAKSELVSQFNQAQNALSDAKKDLTESIAREASKRNEAVAHANSLAQNYVNQAKADALNTIAKEVTDRQQAVSALDTKAQGYVNTAKSDINDTINALGVGGRNLLLGTNSNAKSRLSGGNGEYTTQYVAFNNGYKYNFSYTKASTNYSVYLFSGLQKDKFKPNTDYVLSFMANASTDIVPHVVFANGAGQHNFVKQVSSPPILSSNGDQKVVIQLRTNASIPDESDQSLYMYGFVNKVGTFSIWDLKLETGNKPTDWTNAPEDVVLDYTTKDNKIKETISQYQETNDGKVSKAQTTAQTAVDGLKTKISQTDYNQKTDELSEKINRAKDTADESLRTIGDIKEADGKRDSRISEVERTAGEIKQTVSDLSTAQNKQSGKISTLQQRADGFDATVTKVDNLSVGDRNYILDTANPKTQTSNGKDKQYIYNQARFYSPIKNWGTANGDYVISFDWTLKTALSSDMQASIFFNQSPWQEQSFTVKAGQLTGHVDLKFKLKSGVLTATNDITGLNFRIMSQMASGNTITYSNLFMKSGTIITTWTPAPEDLSSATAKVKQTADEVSAAVIKLTSADGIITKAQADIKANADAINEKVSRTDFNQKTGELSHNVNEAKNTADNAVQTIGDYKTINDKRVHEAESSIERTARAVTEKISQTDYDQQTGELSGKISTLKQRADGFEATVTKVDNLSIGGRNLLLGTRDWTDNTRWDQRGTVTKETYRGMAIASTSKPWWSPKYSVRYANILQVGKTYTFSTYVRNTSDTATNVAPYYEANIAASTPTLLPAHTDWFRVSITFKCVKDPTTSIETLRWEGQNALTNGFIQFAGYKLEEGNLPTDWTPAPEDVQSDITQVKITADDISNFVRDSSGNISYDFQTALSKTSIITGSTLASSIQNQTSSQISSAITDNNGKIISLINQDSSGVQIAGKNLAITADTTVDGNFWANQVNAVKVNASNITAGTLNASDVHIINLDVNRLVGNVSNWILSQWTSATGSNVTIDGNGLYFAPGTSRMTTHGFEAWRDDGGRYAAMGMVGSYNWETNSAVNGMGLIAKYYDREHDDPDDPYRNEVWGADTIAIGALTPEWGRGYNYIDPFLVFPANDETGNRYYPNNGVDTILTGRWLSIYTGLNMRGHAISYSSGYSLKENFDSVSGDIALEIFDNTDILTYDYKPDSNDMDDRTAAGMRNKVGFVINDNGQSPYKIDNRLVRYGNSRDDTVTVGYLMAAVKELHAKVKKLESLNAQEKNNATRY